MTHQRMARPRSRRYRDLPDNLTFDTAKGLYRYRHPVTKRQHYLTNNKAQCVKAAKELNQRLQPADGGLVGQVIGGGHTFAMATYRWESDVMPDHSYSEKTASQYRVYLRKLRDSGLAKMSIGEIEVVHVVDALDRLTAGKRMRNVYRHLMIQAFRCAIELGWCDTNPAEATRQVKTKRQRERLTMEGYAAVYAVADSPLRAAMDLLLVSLQRPEDMVMARYTDESDGRLHVEQQKTGTRLAISIGEELRAAIDATKDGRVCPFIIHRMPRRVKSRDKWHADRRHVMQVFVDQLSRDFRKARDKSGFYKNSDNPPSLYEIKSLGGARYRAMGWTPEQIKQLYGHKDMDMTELYLGDHEPPWAPVSAG